MPRKRRIPIRRRRTIELDAATVRLFGKGQDFFNAVRTRDGEPDLERVREAWDQHRETFMEYWVERHPGYRPWAWWTFEAPEPRRHCLDNRPHPHDLAETPEWVKQLFCGLPRYSHSHQPRACDAFESELDYLARHDLLYEGEAERAEEMGEDANPYRLKIAKAPPCIRPATFEGEN